jgi:predicted transcriptional regulator
MLNTGSTPTLTTDSTPKNCATVYLMPRNNPNTRFSVSLPADLAQALREAADRQYHGNISAAIADAVAGWVRGEAVLVRGIAAMEEYQAEHGEFTAEETVIARAQVAELMGWAADDPRRQLDQTV